MKSPLRVLIVGHGRMGRLVAALGPEHGVDIVGSVTKASAPDAATWPAADVAIDFSTAEAVPANALRLAARGVSLVIGTTGWQRDELALREDLAGHDVGVIAAPNFAIGVNLFLAIAERSAQLLAARGFASWIHEAHHAAKKDAPSGTALAIQRVVEAAGAAVDVSSTRAGHIPGTHTLGFDSPAETITLTHTARDRTAFARGALEAAKWLDGRVGWFTMRDMLGLNAEL
ncbi:MAG TPA: dihydrodipicolinate reductase C-terminal domain-containing protein [Vicinamibacterales bacterium]|nr:dihydrodipicolinate reductase C-terminal domain-containing protein [Vicinamibacterales bacterium]